MLLDFGGGHLAGVCSTQMVPYQRIHIFGSRGLIDVRIPFNAPIDRPCDIVVDTGADLFGGGQERIEFPICDQYTIQGDLFSKAILDDKSVPEPLEDAVRNMECLEAVFLSARTGRRETPGAA
jgi:predicted dehydrogenase